MNAICAEPTNAEAGAATRRAFAGTAALLVRAASRSVAALCADLLLGAVLVLIGILAFIAGGVAIVLSPAPARTPIAE
ncbi:hypothetical protein [Rhodococcus koreensis]